MTPHTPLPIRLVPVLRLALALSFVAIAAIMFVMIPAVAWHDYQEQHGSTGEVLAVAGFLAIVIGLLGCLEVVILCTWKLLTLVQRDEIFSRASDRWVTGIVRAVGAGWILLACTAPYCLWVAQADDAPGLVIVGFALGVVATSALLLMLVMRELLRRATELRAEIDEVI
ncbi:DUF2975 domain-containing protein [Nocardioides sp.]|uniref:DUF2975 domain-containing protein n=1 Tax=Nocardioides sp. TaxID=35761 RepID=UPI002C7016FC|nr:DUF2975 domain-containing protein [Nocardioides sp.]HSX66995.1 DUF2975 domain-containing protein [Nocardioides sp.]